MTPGSDLIPGYISSIPRIPICCLYPARIAESVTKANSIMVEAPGCFRLLGKWHQSKTGTDQYIIRVMSGVNYTNTGITMGVVNAG